MIFLSYNQKDGKLIDTIAQSLSKILGQNKIFYDKWSIQPGDGIIDKMNEGLKNCKFFFFFISKNSLNSNMVKLEWQNALLKATQNKLRFIPVKIDDCFIPEILLQNLYIDVFGRGLENGLRQIIDVIFGKNIYQKGPQIYENIRGYIKKENGDLIIEFRAESYLEPISRYLILIENDKGDFDVKCLSEGMFMHRFNENLKLDNGVEINAFFVSTNRGTSPGFPFVIKTTPKEGKEIKLKGLMRAVNQNEYKLIPLIENEK